jgi:putative tryptophan/tyrosine transport system substrate-binding protein
MNKKIFWGTILTLIIVAVAVFLLLNKNILNKQSSTKAYKVGILNGFDYFGATVDGFKAKMTELGYVEGKNIEYDIQKTAVDIAKYKQTLQKFADEKKDLILTFPTEASMEGKKIAQANNIPMVFTNANVEGMNLINSIREPGNNVTGVRYPGPDIALKRLEVMLKIAPNAKRILVPYDKNYPNVPPQLAILREWAPKMKVTLIELPVTTPVELQNYFDSLAKNGQKIDAILTLSEIVSADPRYVDIYGKYAQENKVPTGGAFILKKNGYNYESLFGVAVDSFAVGEQAAVLANRIFNGIPAGTIPIVSAESYLEINYKAAVAMGIVPSDNVLNTANNIVR